LRIAVLGNYVPRRCGIATFTTGLCEALATRTPESQISVLAMNDRSEGYDYPPRVVFEVDERHLEDYRLAANLVNTSGFDLLCVQHEYGIFGGPAGNYLLPLLRQVRIPVVMTLHTVLREPTETQRRVMTGLNRTVDDFVVMNPRSAEILTDVYGFASDRVHLIDHGVPDLPLVAPEHYKADIAASGRKVLLTFGLISPGKGIEYMIEAMPAIARRHPDTLYIVLGGTHPTILRESGESYRTKLERIARERGVQEHVRFQNEFVGLTRLFEFLRAADLYVTPYLNMDQAVSGTLVYAMGAGKVVVSTPYSHAEVALADGRGRLVPPKDPGALARECIALLDDPEERDRIRRRAYEYTRRMVWPAVADRYVGVFERVVHDRRTKPEPFVWARSPEGQPLGLEETAAGDACLLPPDLPPVKLDHLRALTDSAGILQHARYTIPDRRHGYTTDDNARALLAVVLARYVTPEDPTLVDLAARYLSFLDYAYNDATERFRNFMTYDRRWLEQQGSEDSHGRALWALGTAVALDENEGHRMLAADLFRRALRARHAFRSPRAHAFAVLGLRAYLEWFEDDEPTREILRQQANRIYARFKANAAEDWVWLEDTLTYANAKLPHALIVAGRALGEEAIVETGFDALEWIVSVQKDENGCFSPVGNRGWCRRGGQKPRFDQQPVEAHATLEACLAAFDATRDRRWLGRAERAFEWFLGRNDMLWPLYDASTGGCRDGLMPQGMNENQGAESTLAWLLSLLRMHLRRGVGSLSRAEARRRTSEVRPPSRRGRRTTAREETA
jgi:glycosyltransferase involved in cell wall biosynthesis